MPSTLTSSLRIEAIDNYHPAWQSVLETVEHLGLLADLNLDPDGWLPARQVLLAGFFQTQVAGFICFSIVPKIQNGTVALLAEVESHGVLPQFRSSSVQDELFDAAQERARGLKCQEMIRAAA